VCGAAGRVYAPPMPRSSAPAIALALLFIAALPGCGSGSPGGPAMSGRIQEDQSSLGPDKQSNEIMARDAQTNHAVVKHILVDPDGKAQALDLLRRLRAGEAIEPLMKQFSKDPGSADSGESYDVTPSAQLVFEFKRLGLRLRVGEVGLVKSEFGWHVMKRIE
jgi:parvulin-like peptidyl-prolyl isomerase